MIKYLSTYSTIKKGILFASVLLILGLSGYTLSHAKVYIKADEALKKAFPEAANIERKTFFLTDDEIKRIEEASGAKMESKLFIYYTAVGKSGIAGYAVIGSRIIRTKPAVYMIKIRPDLEIDDVVILAFSEPEEYLPSRRWLDQFIGKKLGGRLWINRDIHAISGATLTSYAITREARKALAVFEIKMNGGVK